MAKQYTSVTTNRSKRPRSKSLRESGGSLGGSLSAVAVAAQYIHPTNGADATIEEEAGRVLASIIVNNLGHVTAVGYKSLDEKDIPALSISKINGLATALSNKLDKQFFANIFTVYDSDGNAIVPNTYTQVADNLKILVGTWTEEYLSALGKNSEGGGGGTGTVTAIKIASNPDVFIDPVDGIIDMSSYATTWNNKQNTITDLATIRSNASHGNTAYSWGNHANAGYAQASNTVSNVAYNSNKLQKTIDGSTTDIVSASTLVTDGGGAKASTTITAGNGLTGGGDLSSNRTINVVSANAAITVNADNIKLNVINDYTTTTNNTIIPLAAARGKDLNDRLAVLESWFEVDSDGNVKTKDMPNGTHRGFYTESFVSALGANSSGGGSGADLGDVWDSLTNQTGTTPTETTKIAIAHIPDTASTYGYLKSSALSGYATQTWVNQQGFLTTHQTLYTLSIYGGTTKVLDFKPNANASIYIKAGGDISLDNDTTNKYITLSYTHPTNGANTTISAASGKVLSAITVNNLGHVTSVSSKTLAAADIPDISATYATASRATTLEGYFTNGVANSAAKLNTGTTTYSAWGQTYWSSGVPQSISGNMTSVGSITPSANGNALGTTSARFAIYGTSGNYSSTLTVADAITLSGTTSAKKRIYFGDTSHYLELDSTGFHFSHGVYSDSFVSALGANSSGGGGGGVDLTAVWASLTNTENPTYSTTLKINANHIPNLNANKITEGTLAAARIPVATASAVGGIKVGTTLAISDGVLNQKSGIATAGTYRSVTVDTYGRVTAGTNPSTLAGYGITDAKIASGTITLGSNAITPLTSSSSLAWGKLTGTPTTLSGYGISDAYTKTQVDNALSGYLVRKTYSISGKSAVRITFNNGNGGIISARVTKQSGSLVLIGNGYGDEGIVRNNWVQISESTSYFSWCIPTATGIEKSVEIYNNDTTTARIVVASFDTDVTFTELSALSTTASTEKVAYASDYLPLTGGTMTGSIKMDATAKGYYLVDSAGVSYPAVFDNGSYLCIGANTVSGTHHTGNTYISAGSGEVYISRLVNNSRTNYKNLDAGNTYVSSGKGYLNGSEITTISGNAATATKATQDGDGRTITSTYLTSVDISGDSLVQTKGGTTSSVANIFYRDCTVQYTLSTAGWYRIAAFSTNLAHGGTCFLLIRRTFNSTSPESYIFAITLRYGSGISISQLSGSYGVALIDKIRVEYANNTSFAPQIDIHVSSTTNGNAYRITTIGSAAAFATATLNPTVANSTYEYTTRNGMSCSGDFYAGGEVTAASDERLKTIVGDATLSLKDIANAPNVLFRWNDGRDDKVHGGSIAQYWLQKASQFVGGDENGFYSLNYGALALCSAITIAREVVKHEDEITRLKKEVVKLRERVAELEERRIA